MVTVGFTAARDLTAVELALVPDEEKNRTFGSAKRRRQFLCGRSLLRLMLQERTGKPAASHRLTTTDGGKPVCIDGPAVSITHTGERVACSVAENGDIGIDMEIVDEQRDMHRIAREFFSAEEFDWLDAQPRNRFFMLWVLKEAYVKALGQSIFGGLNKLRCKVLPPKIVALGNDEHAGRLHLYAADGLYLALATTEAPLNGVTFHRWEPGAERLLASNEFHLTATTADHAE